VLFPSQWRVAWPVFRALQSLTLGTLPPGIRAAYGFAWSARDERSLARWVRLLRSLRRRLPPFAREWPIARRGLNRTSRTTQRMTAHMKAHLTVLTPGTPGCSVAASQHGTVIVDRNPLVRNITFTRVINRAVSTPKGQE
jgi:hypothetical protein